uniref:DNA-directed RNA polymerase n=1 Tax=Termitomyces sp. K2P1 TaxID=2811480 RepID=A0A8F1ACS6_9AGAR|nr:RNA polymerase [Termitomyces sp. K2P1]
MNRFYNKMHRHMVNLLNLSPFFIRQNHSVSVINNTNNVAEEHSIKDTNELIKNYDIRWTQEYKNLNEMLGLKGLKISKHLDINKIKYLVFSLTNTKSSFNTKEVGNRYEKDIFYSLSLVVSDLKSLENNNFLYDKIICNLKNNSSLIREGGILDIYYVSSSKIDNNVKEGFRNYSDFTNYKCLIPSISEVINLNKSINNKKLIVNIYIFSCDTFFREYLTTDSLLFTKENRSKNTKLWGYPILIIEDMYLSTVTYLFKERGINIHGMSITRRHLLSPLEKNLSNFLYVTDLDDTIKNSHLYFTDEFFSSKKIDFQLYKDISKIQEYNLNKRSAILKEIESTLNLISSNSEYKSSNNNLLYLKYKLQNLENNSMNPLVLILILRNQIFELEKLINEKKGSHKDLLSLHSKIKLEVDELIKKNDNDQIILEELHTRVEKLDLEILNLNKIIQRKQKEVNDNKIINQENKQLRKIAAKKNKLSKSLKKELKSNLVKSNKLNEELTKKEQLLKNSKKFKKESQDILKKTQKENLSLKMEIENKKRDHKNSEIKLRDSNEELEKMSQNLNFISNLPFSKDFVNNINNRSRKGCLIKSDFSNKNNFGKRKFSTLNNHKRCSRGSPYSEGDNRKYSIISRNILNLKNVYLITNNVGPTRILRTVSTLPSVAVDGSFLAKKDFKVTKDWGGERDSDCINPRDLVGRGLGKIITEITTNPIYVKIGQILVSSDFKNNRERQLHIEETLKFFWNQELNKIFEGKKNLFSNSIGIHILMDSISALDKVLNILKSDRRYLKNKSYRNHIMLTENGIIVSIVLSNTIPHLMKYKSNKNIATLFYRLGKELHTNLLNIEWHKYNNNTYKNTELSAVEINYSVELNKNKFEFKKGLSKDQFSLRLNEILGTIPSDDYFKLGCDLAEIVSENSNLFKFMNVPNEDNTVQKIIVPDKGLEDKIVKLLGVDTEKLVMICEPSKWDVSIIDSDRYIINQYGGFLLNSINKNDFISKSQKNSGVTKLDNLKIIDTINYLGSIPFEINTHVLKHIMSLIVATERDPLLYNQEKLNELIKLNIHPNTKDIYNLNLSKKFGEVEEIQKHNSQFYSDKTIITNALLFSSWCDSSQDNKIYFNYFIDWRGRLYTDTSYLSFQGSVLARSLLMFKGGEVLTERGVEHLKIYTANCYGHDKKSYNERLDWTNKNLEKIISAPNLLNLKFERDLSDLPYDQGTKTREFYNFMLKADEPFLFLSCCLELKNYYADPTHFVSKLPIYLDATCNGLQHLSVMINDTCLARYVNILHSNKEEIPKDVYNHMISYVKDKIHGYIKEDLSLAILDNININRKFIKPGIMKISYGTTTRGIMEQLRKDHFRQLDLVKGKKLTFLLKNNEFNNTKFDIYLNFKQLLALAKAIHSVLYEVFPNLTILVKYLKDMNKLLKDLKLPTIWLTPAGLIIEQNYRPFISRELTTSILGKRRSITLREFDQTAIDLRRQNNAIVPNVVHSFDASNIALLVENISSSFSENQINLLTIHDCFATNANDVEDMILKVKLAFISLYSDKLFIDGYHNFILEFLCKSGFHLIEKEYKGEKIKQVQTETANFPIPKKPLFTSNKDLRFNLLGSQYFIN